MVTEKKKDSKQLKAPEELRDSIVTIFSFLFWLLIGFGIAKLLGSVLK